MVFLGINAGISSGLVPMYLTELSPIKFRGMFGSLSQLVTTITILLAQVLGLPYILGTADKWPFMFGKHFYVIFYIINHYSDYYRSRNCSSYRIDICSRVSKIHSFVSCQSRKSYGRFT